MKKVIIGIASVIVAIVSILTIGIAYYLPKYDTGNATIIDVLLIDLHIKDHKVVDSRGGSNYVIASPYWDFEDAFVNDLKKIEQFGASYECVDKDGNAYFVTMTDDWCAFFRIYQIDKRLKLK